MMDKAVCVLKVVNHLGLHTRAATIFVRKANTFSSEIKVSANGITANAKSIMGLLALGARIGTELILSAKGQDQNLAIAELSKLIKEGFEENSNA